MTGLGTLMACEWKRLRRRPSTWVVPGILLGYLVLVLGSLLLVLRAPRASGVDTSLLTGPLRMAGLVYVSRLYASIASVLILVQTTMLVAPEFSRGTLRTLLLMGQGRSGFVVAKVLTVLVLAGGYGVLGVVCTLVAAAVLGPPLGTSLLPSPQALPMLTAMASVFVRVVVTLAAWAMVALALALWTRSLAWTIAATLGFQIMGDLVAALLAGLGPQGSRAANLLLDRAVAQFATARHLSWSQTETGWLALDLALYVGLPLWYAWRRFQRMDALAATRNT